MEKSIILILKVPKVSIFFDFAIKKCLLTPYCNVDRQLDTKGPKASLDGALGRTRDLNSENNNQLTLSYLYNSNFSITSIRVLAYF